MELENLVASGRKDGSANETKVELGCKQDTVD